ncbi:hypothetical protein [Abiotrophia defectiva]|uniref:DUF1653 domain-containing protein n=2 Tax=Abiotrophia defectiva TaxID=46125 RepID=W1Q2H2_ABIDE|nr:hypothetical protein [Abiotrophia defectiva]ESK65310.1 hypothetical protein GCWU000182_01471 [Abiotrophia defectiva ATCC 49176]QKH47698.1 hypothetical protein FOC79_08830 [Abiotrophia defectiva]
MNELQPGKHYRHVNSGKVVMPVGIALEEDTFRKVVVYVEKVPLTDNVWTRPLDQFMDGRFELVEDGKELRPVAGFPEFKPVLDPEKILAENEELKLQVNSLRYQRSEMKDELWQLKSENKMLNRRIDDLKWKVETSEVPF